VATRCGGETAASASAKAGSRRRGRLIGSLLAWALLASAIAVSLRPAIPVIWGDTPPFLDSALRTFETGTLTVVGGRDPGYPALLAAIFALGGGLGTMVRVQQAAWAILIVVLAATAQLATRRSGAVAPIILVALYPGLLMFRNIITADLVYTVLLNLAVCSLLLAAGLERTARCWAVGAGVIAAALAACCRSQGLLVPVAAALSGAWIARPGTPARMAVIGVSCAASLGLLVTGSRFAVSASDEASAVFVAKTLFCNHLDIVLASDAARREIAAQAGPRAGRVLSRLAVDFATEPGYWPVLGFFGDACLFDAMLDEDIAPGAAFGDTLAAKRAASTYRRTFVAAVLDRPLAYGRKVMRQMGFGLLDAWPPLYGLDRMVPVSTDDVPHVANLLARHGRAAEAAGLGTQVQGGLLSALPSTSTALFRTVSAAFLIALLFWSWTGLTTRRHRRRFVAQGGIVIVMWTASIVTAAAAHTLDISRYLVPATPIVALMLSIFAVEAAERARRLQKTNGPG
jgi:hypothetical protein